VGGDYDAELVELEGQLVGQDDAATDPNIVLSSQNQVFSAVLPAQYRGQLPAWKRGTTFKIVGICSVKNGTDRAFVTRGGFSLPNSFRILLRSPQDVVVITSPSWWTPTHAIGVLGLAAVLTLVVLGWVFVLRKRVDEQTHYSTTTERTGQLKTANLELEAFSYSVSHDLRTPLRHIAGFSGILLRDFGPGMAVEAKEHLQPINDAVIHMGLLVQGLLSLAKIGRQSLNLHLTELNPIVEQVISVLQSECEGREVEWRIGSLSPLECDRTLVRQIFQNLLGNAVKYSRYRDHAVIEVDSKR
jgi:signal transduction histidine kinase